MTEAEWLACTDPMAMLGFLRDKASERKLRLSLVATVRACWDRINLPRLLHLIEVGEQYADGAIAKNEFDGAGKDFYRVGMEMARTEAGRRQEIQFFAAHAPVLTHQGIQALNKSSCGRSLRSLASGELVSFLREVFGRVPFGTVAADPAWLTSTVVSLAEGIYADRAFDRLPFLADALLDAGCENLDVLGHCRGPGPHVRGCWVVDLLLDKG